MWLLIGILTTVIWRMTDASQCACATGNVHVREGPGTSHKVLGTLAHGQCTPYKAKQVTADSYIWAEIDFQGKVGWSITNYINMHTCSNGNDIQLPGCPNIVRRSEWSARNSVGGPWPLTAVPHYVFVHHSTGAGCTSKADCEHKVKSFQNYHMDTHHWPDIGYSFLIGEDGNAYEGRGWNQIGAHTYNYNSVGLGICVIGDFTNRVPNSAALNALKQLIKCGLDNGRITYSYTLRGHRDMGATECPGNMLYALIRTWPHY